MVGGVERSPRGRRGVAQWSAAARRPRRAEHLGNQRFDGLLQRRRGSAPPCGPGRRRDLPLRDVVPRRRAALVRLLRPARPEGAVHLEVRAPDRTGRSSATGRRPGRTRSVADRAASTRWRRTSSRSSPGRITRSAAEHDGIPLGCTSGARWREQLGPRRRRSSPSPRRASTSYHGLFGVRYPFGEYHQAFVPEFNAGAMENPGCVTFRDELLSSAARATDAERRRPGRT